MKSEKFWCFLAVHSCDGLFLLLAHVPGRHKDTVSSSIVFAKVSANVIALNRCSVMEMHWNKNEVWQLSSQMAARRWIST